MGILLICRLRAANSARLFLKNRGEGRTPLSLLMRLYTLSVFLTPYLRQKHLKNVKLLYFTKKIVKISAKH